MILKGAGLPPQDGSPAALRIEDFAKYTDFVLQNTFEMDENENSIKVLNAFYSGGFLLDRKMDEMKVDSFLNENRTYYELMADEYLKEINN